MSHITRCRFCHAPKWDRSPCLNANCDHSLATARPQRTAKHNTLLSVTNKVFAPRPTPKPIVPSAIRQPYSIWA